MNKLFTLFILLSCLTGTAQNKLRFDYDAAGNQIFREWCSNCASKETPKDSTAIVQEDLIKFSPEDIISYYPNPVKEQLYVKWDLNNKDKVVSVDLYNLTGQLIKSIKIKENTDSQTISFQDLPHGIYSLLFVYTNGEQRTIKIIKN